MPVLSLIEFSLSQIKNHTEELEGYFKDLCTKYDIETLENKFGELYQKIKTEQKKNLDLENEIKDLKLRIAEQDVRVRELQKSDAQQAILKATSFFKEDYQSSGDDV